MTKEGITGISRSGFHRDTDGMMYSDTDDYGVPQWKKELIWKRRTHGRALTTAGGVVGLKVTCPTAPRAECPGGPRPAGGWDQLDFHPGCSVGTMRLLEADLSGELLVNGVKRTKTDRPSPRIMVEEKPAKKPAFRNMDKRKEVKVISDPKNEDDYHSDSSEELQYGPGIVSKLKTKYLSMTLRENQKRHCRPSLSNLRRATSLENMLDEDADKCQPKIQYIKKSVFPEAQKNSKLSHHRAKYLGLSRGNDSMKRARSMETLLRSVDTLPKKPGIFDIGITNGNITSSLINEDIVIVDSVTKTEKCKHSEYNPDKELPPPDVVKQTLKIFESTASKKSKDLSGHLKPKTKPPNNKPNIQPKVHIEKHKCNGNSKPILSPKPVLSPEKRNNRPKVVPKPVVSVSCSTPSPSSKPLTLPIDERTALPTATSPLSPISPISFPDVNDIENDTEREEQIVKYISQMALENISKEGLTMKYCFSDSPSKNYLPKLDIAQATNTALISSQTTELKSPDSPSSQVKQVAIIRPTNKMQNQGLTDQEIEKNHINRVKSIEPARVIPIKNESEPNIKKNSTTNEKSAELWGKKHWQNQNSVVFNFSDRKSIPDYIENDGLILASRRSRCNGNEEETDCSVEDESDTPSPCNIRFIGDNILINGKSSFRKEPKQQKLRIQFNDEATTLFEYPSEESMTEEGVTNNISSSKATSLTLGSGTLSNYTPCKTSGADGFELGVTRAAPVQTNQSPQSVTAEDSEEYLKPVDSSEVTPWSQETAADILF